MSGPALQVQALCAAYGPMGVLDHVDLEVGAGELCAVLGASGCGKTTLLRVIAGLAPATAGRIVVGGRELSNPHHIVPTVQRRVGLVFQEYALFPDLTIEANVAFAPQAESAHVRQLLELTGLSDLAGRYPRQLSGGQQQRVALARALAARPDVLLLDEPFANLDPMLRGQLGLDLRSLLRDQNCATVLVTHDRTDALGLADQVVVLLPGERGGQVAAAGAPAEVWAAPPTPAVAQVVSAGCLWNGSASAGEALTSIGTVRCPDDHNGPIELWVRPDQVHFEPGDGPHQVTACRFVGPFWEAEVLADGQRVWVHTTQPAKPGTLGRATLREPPWLFR